MAVASCAGAAPTAPSATGQQGPAPASAGPKRITIGIRGDPKTLSARLNSAAGAGGVPGVVETEELLNAGLAIEDSSNVFHAQLAEAVPSVENGLWQVFPDGTMQTTWKVRDGAQWHDGTPFTSDDILFTSTVERDDDLPIFRNVAYGSVDHVEAPDPQTVVMYWKKPYIQADAMFTSSRALPLPRHLLERAYQEDKDSFVNLPYWNRDFVGTGPFKLREYSEGVHVLLDANDSFVLGRPKIDQIEVKFIPDPSTMGANLLAGGVDLTLGGRLSFEWGEQIRDQWHDGKMETAVPTSYVGAYPQFINPNPAVIGDVQFRRALLQAANRQQLVDTLVDGLAPIAHALINPSQAEWKDVESSVVKYDYDPRAAQQAIEALGYTRGGDGTFRDASGQRLSVEIRTTSTDDSQMKTMFSLADYWQQVGVASEQVAVPQQRESDREYRATRPAFEVVRQPGGWVNLERFYGPNTPLPENNYTGVDRPRYQNPQLDALIDRFFVTVPMAERMQVLSQAVNILSSQVVVLGMFWDIGPTMVSNRLQNMSAPGDVWDAHLWDVSS